jgi:hypothetical protein
MVHKFLITNNTDRNHPADVWAMTAAEMVADVAGLTGPKVLEAQRLHLKFAEVLQRHFEHSSAQENAKLANDPAHVNTPIHEHRAVDLDEIAKELEEAANGTSWEGHYQLPEVQHAVMTELKMLFHSSMHVDRLTHADRNPDCKHAAAYKAAHHGVK